MKRRKNTVAHAHPVTISSIDFDADQDAVQDEVSAANSATEGEVVPNERPGPHAEEAVIPAAA